MNNKSILEIANAAVSAGDNEGFLAFCTEDVTWAFVGDKTLSGKDAVRKYMAEVYVEPPSFMVETLIAEGDYVTAIGKISLAENGRWVQFEYCDVWKFRDGKMCNLRAFVIAS